MDGILWGTSTAVSVGDIAQAILPAYSLFIHLVFGSLPSYVDIYM